MRLSPLEDGIEATEVNLLLGIEGKDLEGTVRPDWICMRVVSLESPLKGHQPLYVIHFFIFDLEYYIRVQSSEPLHAKMNPTSCLLGSRFA